ncbi:MAG: SCO family protein [Acidiferrobacterales bacterium]|nr:SCO family protein [Acidiferrobacterales bacterium]
MNQAEPTGLYFVATAWIPRFWLIFIFLITPFFSANAEKKLGGDFTLTDQHGDLFELEQLRGRKVLLYFGFLNCPDICPLELNTIGKTIREVGADQVAGVFVTLDPQRDSPDKIGQYVQFFHPDIIGLTGSDEDIARVAEQYNIRYRRTAGENYTIDHSIHIVVLDRDGQFKAISPFGASVDQLSALVRGLQ